MFESLYKKFKEHNFSLYLVGGAVRDIYKEIAPHDYDFCTDATPEEIIKIFPKSILTGIKHGTLTVPFENTYYEITTFRKDGTYTDSRRPDNVIYSKNIEDDLHRRDFTVNSLAINLENDKLIDLFNGLEDIKFNIVRCVGDPDKRFSEDPLRIFRAFRLVSKGFSIEPITWNSILKNKDKVKTISKERVISEILKISKEKYNYISISLLRSSGVFLSYFNKEIGDFKKLEVHYMIVLYFIFFNFYIYELSNYLDRKTTNTIQRLRDCVDLKDKCNKEIIYNWGNRDISILQQLYEIYGYKLEYTEDPIFLYEIGINGHELKKYGIYGKDIGNVLRYIQEEIWKDKNVDIEKLIYRITRCS